METKEKKTNMEKLTDVKHVLLIRISPQRSSVSSIQLPFLPL